MKKKERLWQAFLEILPDAALFTGTFVLKKAVVAFLETDEGKAWLAKEQRLKTESEDEQD